MRREKSPSSNAEGIALKDGEVIIIRDTALSYFSGVLFFPIRHMAIKFD